MRRGPRTVDKIAYVASMFLSAPKPTFLTVGKVLGEQAMKGVEDNINHYFKRR